MHSRIASQASKAQTPITSSFGVKPQTVQTAKERNNKAPDPKFNFNLSKIAASHPGTPRPKPQVNLKHHLQLAQNNPVRELQRQKQRENKIKTVNLKSFTSSSSPIPPPTKRVNSSIIARKGIKGHYTRVSRKIPPSISHTTKSPYFNSPKRVTVNNKPISLASRKINSPLIQRKKPPKSPSFKIRNYSATPSVQTFPTSIAEAKQAILGKIAGWAQDIPGYYLLRVILGKDPISEESVPRTSANIIRGVISLIPGGERLYQQMNQTGAIDRAGAWLDKNIAKLNLTWATISSLIGKAWDSLSLWDFRSPSKVFGKIKKVFSPLVSRIINFAKSAGNQLLEFILEGALKLAGPLATKVMGILKGAGQLFTNIIKDPIKFVNNLVKGLKQGFQSFIGNIWTHLKKGLIGWLTGALGGANIELPDDIFSLSGAFSLVTQVLGLTFGYIRRKAVKMFGEKVVSAMEKGVSLFQTLQSGGVNALWDLVQDKMSDLKSMVIDQIKDTVVGQVIQAGIKWIIGLLNPAGALLKAGMAIYEIIVFFVNRASQIAELVQAVMQAVKAISQGAVGGAAKLVENALAKALPVAIGFLASLLGINGLAKKVQNIIKGVRKKIDGAIEKLLKKAVKFAKKIGGKFGKKEKKGAKKDKDAAKLDVSLQPVPFNMSSTGHTLYIQKISNRAIVFMASKGAALLTKLQNAEARTTNQELKKSLQSLQGAVSKVEGALNAPNSKRKQKEKLQRTLARLALNIGRFGTKHKIQELEEVYKLAEDAGNENLSKRERRRLNKLPDGPQLLQKIDNEKDKQKRIAWIQEARIALDALLRGETVTNLGRELPRDLSPGEVSELKKKHHQQRLVEQIKNETDMVKKAQLLNTARGILKKKATGTLTELDVETKNEVIQVAGETYGPKAKKLERDHDIQLTKTIDFVRKESKASGKKPRKVIVHLVNPKNEIDPKLIKRIQEKGKGKVEVEVEVRVGPR